MQIEQATNLGISLKRMQLLCPCRRELLCEVLPEAALVLLPEDILREICVHFVHVENLIVSHSFTVNS